MLHPATIAAFRDELEKIANAGALHGTVQGFMGALKSLPKGSAARGKLITSHMNHGPFLSALKSHPQGDQMHKMLTSHLNSAANAGVKPGKTVVKVASHAAELAGLGILAAPSIGHLRGKEWSEKNKSRAEVAGLGVLAAPSAMAVGKKMMPKAKKLISSVGKQALKHASAEKIAMDFWNPATGKVFGEAASKVRQMAGGAAKAAPKAAVKGEDLLKKIKDMKRTGQTGTLAASSFAKQGGVGDFLGKLMGRGAAKAGTAVAKAAPKMSFQGHGAAMKSLNKATTNARGVTTAKSFDPLSQAAGKKKWIEI